MNMNTVKAIEVARATGWDLFGWADDHGWQGVGVGPVGHHRDSEALAESNWQVVYADLASQFPGQVAVASFGHWGVGWVEELTYNTGIPALIDAVEQWERALANYPVADDMHYAEVEWEMNHPTDEECYGGSDCPCGNG